MDSLQIWWSEVQTFIVGVGFVILGFCFHAYLTRTNAMAANKRSAIILDEAQKKARAIEHEATIRAREERIDAREKADQSLAEKRQQILALEDRMVAREKKISQRLEQLDQKERALLEKLERADERHQALEMQKAQWAQRIEEENRRIEQLASCSEQEARALIMQRVETELEKEIGDALRRHQKAVQDQARTRAREIVCSAIERCAVEHVTNLTTTQVKLPSDEMKGRIIGKEGRNIRAFEMESGVDLIIDETPEVVLLSCFDPVRRDIARVALERLIDDGRIHPASIEEMLQCVRLETEELMRQAGEEALLKLGISGVDPELVPILGRLKYRTSYKQNVLEHSLEMAALMGVMAADLHLNSEIAKRIGIFHDLGKAVDHEADGSHATIGANLLRKYGEAPVICDAVAAHHEEIEQRGIYAVLATAADAMTAARPGARFDSSELYLERLEHMEQIANSFDGVNKSYAIRAGRELRVIVRAEQVNDVRALLLAREIANQIQGAVHHPGAVKVSVIRETRAIEYAR